MPQLESQPLVPIHLTEPPVPVAMGVGVHGVAQSQDTFRLPSLWCLHLYTYRGTIEVNGETLPIRPGYAGITPANTSVTYRYETRSMHLYAHFQCSSGPEPVRIPLMQDLGSRFPAVYSGLEEIVLQPMLPAPRKAARLWELLFQLSDAAQSGDEHAGLHPVVRQTLTRIERELTEPLRVETLAHDANVSYGYLSRLFQRELGTSVVGYLQNRRMEKARLLLRESTLPVKAIAQSVGIPDLHQFNKACRRAHGISPRALRQATEDQ